MLGRQRQRVRAYAHIRVLVTLLLALGLLGSAACRVDTMPVDGDSGYVEVIKVYCQLGFEFTNIVVYDPIDWDGDTADLGGTGYDGEDCWFGSAVVEIDGDAHGVNSRDDIEVFELGAGWHEIAENNIERGFWVEAGKLTKIVIINLVKDVDNGGLSGGVLATFEVDGEQFRVWVTNPTTIQQILDLQAGTSTATIPSGVIHYGPGEGNHNAPWNWHLDPEQIEMAEVTIELCDARPSYVEANTAYFVEVVGGYCPWGATLVSVEDLR